MGSTRYILCVDTEQYAGNFERPLTAWITGQIGDCGVGDNEAQIARKELSKSTRKWFSDHVEYRIDDRGVYRPTEIQPTPGWANTGMGLNYRLLGADKAALLATYVQSVRNYYAPFIANAEAKITAGDKRWKADLKGYQERIAEAEARTELHQYPAFLSVGIFLNTKPPKPILKVIKARAATFNQRPTRREWDEDITITGFRLVTETATEESEDI